MLISQWQVKKALRRAQEELKRCARERERYIGGRCGAGGGGAWKSAALRESGRKGGELEGVVVVGGATVAITGV